MSNIYSVTYTQSVLYQNFVCKLSSCSALCLCLGPHQMVACIQMCHNLLLSSIQTAFSICNKLIFNQVIWSTREKKAVLQGGLFSIRSFTEDTVVFCLFIVIHLGKAKLRQPKKNVVCMYFWKRGKGCVWPSSFAAADVSDPIWMYKEKAQSDIL